MSAESQSQTRKRKERKRKKDSESSDKIELMLKDSHDVLNEEDALSKESEIREKDDAHDDHHHYYGPSGGVLSTVVFFLLLGGLVALTVMIFIELKGSKEVGPSIAESRYASILGDLVDDHALDEHDKDEHEPPQLVEHDEDGSDEDESDEHDESDFHAASHPQHDDDDEDAEHEEGVEESDGAEIVPPREEPEVEKEFEAAEVVPPPEEAQGTEEISNIEAANSETETQEVQHTEPVDEPWDDILKTLSEQDTNENWMQDDSDGGGSIDEAADVEADQRQEDVVASPPESVVPVENEVENLRRDTASFAESAPNEQTQQPSDTPEVHEAAVPLNQGDEELSQAPQERESPPGDPWEFYEHADTTNEYDYGFRADLDEADNEMERSAEKAKQMFEDVLRSHPQSPRAAFGKAKCLDKLSELQKSNSLLEESIYSYRNVLNLPNVPDKLFRLAGERCADRMNFRGFIAKATRIQQKLIERFPEDPALRNQLAVSYLLLGQNKSAKEILQEVLKLHPHNGFAKVHYGFILKTEGDQLKEAIRYMREGIASEEPGTIDGRFFFHLGDALTREGLVDQAYDVYESGVKKGLFRSVYQRSLYNVDELTGRPWWTAQETSYAQHFKKLEENWQIIKQEGLALLDEKQQGFTPESEGLRDTGVWKQFELFARGQKVKANCAKAPKTCQFIGAIPDAAGCTRGQVKFSIMLPGTHVWAHTGPTNCRIRAHLGLVIPEGVRIRVANETKSWTEGKFIIFDDSFEHEVWHNGSSFRLILIVDFWHPELTEYQKRTLTPI